jgi:hypothetical protein
VADRWGLSYTPEAGITPVVAPDETYTCSFTIVAPPITTLAYTAPVGPTDPGALDTLECDWALANGGALVTDSGLCENDIGITRFPDTGPGTDGAWAAFYIEQAAGRAPEIVKGFPDGLYRPRLTMTRDAMAVFVRRAMKIPQVFPDPAEWDEEEEEWVTYNTFPDVPFNELSDPPDVHWAVGDIEALVAAEVVQGYEDGLYHPDWWITRAQMAVYVARATDYYGDVESYYEDGDPLEGDSLVEEDVFPDVPADFWAAPEILCCVRNFVVQGYPYLDPETEELAYRLYQPTWQLSRDQIAVFTYRAFVRDVACAIVLAGPATTDADPSTWDTAADVGASTVESPDYAYLAFDAVRWGDGSDLAYNGTFDVVFQFLEDEGPTLAGQAAVGLLPGEMAAANTAAIASGEPYHFVSVAVPELETGAYTMVVSVEDETGAMHELPRRVSLNVTVPPPPPGPEGPFPANSLGDARWNAAAGMDDGRDHILSGSFDNLKDSDNMYLVLEKYPWVPHSTSWADSTVAWDLCCGETVLGNHGDLGSNLLWNDIVIPTGATEMKITIEYRVDPGQFYCCNMNPCANDGQAWHGMGEPWDSEQAPMGWGAGVVDWGDAWALSTWGSEADLFKDHDNPGAFNDNEYARLSRVEEVVVWTVPIADAAKYVDTNGDVLVHFCGGGKDLLYFDVAVVEFTIPPAP